MAYRIFYKKATNNINDFNNRGGLQLKFSKIINLPVIAAEEQEYMGNVIDIIFNPEQQKIIAIVFTNNKLLSSRKAIGIDKILSIDKNSVWIKDKKKIINSTLMLRNNKLKSYKTDFDNKKIYTDKKNDLGFINDVIFNTEIGTIEGFEISDGVLQDLIDGRKYITTMGMVDTRKESIFIAKENIGNIRYNGKGLRRILGKE